MPAFSFKFHRPRFLRTLSLRPWTPNPPPASPRNDATAPLSLDPVPSHASSSCHPSSVRASQPGANTTSTGAPSTSAPGNNVHHQFSKGRLVEDRLLDNFDGQPLPGSHAGTPQGIVSSNTTPILDPHGPATAHSTFLTSPSKYTDSFLGPHSLEPPHAQHPLATHRNTLSILSTRYSEALQEPSNRYLPKPEQQNQGMFSNAHDFTVSSNQSAFVAGNIGSVNFNTSNQFMEKLLKETIPGAASDSSDRDPPPRCHPRTRLAILDRCLSFIHSCDGQRKVRWVVGAAGVGKSAIMQSVAESPELRVHSQASVFFSINGRNNGTKTVITLSYQLAAKSEPYCQAIEKVIRRDPSLLRTSMAKQFLKFIIEPFIHDPQLNSAGRILIIIDGLDECKKSRTQLELLRLISNFCIKYPSSPLVWLIASRPEAHITSFFASADAKLTYEKEEIAVDSDEARVDVERFLRHELIKIKEQASDSLGPQWPDEMHIWKLANASGGLFAYAQAVIRYIGDSTISSPALQLLDVLNVIDNHPMTGIPPEEHPMALLDALYARILSNVPPRSMINTRKLLLALALGWDQDSKINRSFLLLCNWLGITPDEAYAALNHLRSIIHVPRRNDAHRENLRPFHKSVTDYICDFSRSGFSPDIGNEAQQLMTGCTFRVLMEAPDGIDVGDTDYNMHVGRLARGPGTGDNISLTWPADKGVDYEDGRTRTCLYQLAIGEVVAGTKRRDPTFQSGFYIRVLTTRFLSYGIDFPHFELRDFVFDERRRDEFTMHGILKLIPLKEVDISRIFYEFKLQFRRPATQETGLSDPWFSSCPHKREGEWEGGKEQNWTTVFLPPVCHSCSERFCRQMETWKVKSPDCGVPVLFTSTEQCCVEVRFVDSEDGVSEWTYWFWARVTPEQQEKYWRTV